MRMIRRDFVKLAVFLNTTGLLLVFFKTDDTKGDRKKLIPSMFSKFLEFCLVMNTKEPFCRKRRAINESIKVRGGKLSLHTLTLEPGVFIHTWMAC